MTSQFKRVSLDLWTEYVASVSVIEIIRLRVNWRLREPNDEFWSKFKKERQPKCTVKRNERQSHRRTKATWSDMNAVNAVNSVIMQANVICTPELHRILVAYNCLKLHTYKQCFNRIDVLDIANDNCSYCSVRTTIVPKHCLFARNCSVRSSDAHKRIKWTRFIFFNFFKIYKRRLRCWFWFWCMSRWKCSLLL